MASLLCCSQYTSSNYRGFSNSCLSFFPLKGDSKKEGKLIDIVFKSEMSDNYIAKSDNKRKMIREKKKRNYTKNDQRR